MERVDVLFTDKSSGGSWAVLEQNGRRARATYFRGEDAQKRAYEYAAGLLGKKGETVPKIDGNRLIDDFGDVFAQVFANIATYEKARESARDKWSGATYAAPPSPWISVKERMPKDGQFVLSVKVNEYMRIAEHYRGKWTHAVNGCDIPNVTHWMPLPEPPKE